MPVYRYAPCQLPCKLCGEGFEHRSGPAAADLTACPTCGQAVTRLGINTVNSPKLSRPLSVSDAKNAGFTVLKRLGDGEYERQ